MRLHGSLVKIVPFGISAFLAGIGIAMIRPALTYYSRYELYASATQVSSLTTGFMIARALVAPTIGYLGDVYVKVRGYAVKYGLLGAVLVSLAYYYTSSFMVLMALYSLHGFIYGIVWPTVQTLVGTIASPKDKGKCMTLYFTFGGLGLSLGYKIYGTLNIPDKMLFILGTFSYIIASIALSLTTNYGLKVNDLRFNVKSEFRFRGMIAGRGTLWILLVSLMSGYILGLMYEFLFLYLREVHDVGKELLGNMLLTASIIGTFLNIPIGFIADKYSIKHVLVWIITLAIIGSLILSLRLNVYFVILAVVLLVVSGRVILPLTRSLASLLYRYSNRFCKHLFKRWIFNFTYNIRGETLNCSVLYGSVSLCFK